MTRAPERPAHPWGGAPSGAGEPAGARAPVRGRRAGVVTRCLANVVDAAVVLLLLAACYAAVAAARFVFAPSTFRFPSPSLALLVAAFHGALALYFAVTWSVAGRTHGDRLLGLRVVDDSGRRLRAGRAGVRAVLCAVFLAGVLWVLVSRENRSVQDLLVRTSVVYE
ncbi:MULTISPECIES: RDD family protein [unclassified Blastococcus]